MLQCSSSSVAERRLRIPCNVDGALALLRRSSLSNPRRFSAAGRGSIPRTALRLARNLLLGFCFSVFRTLVARGVYSLDLQPAETKLNTYRKNKDQKLSLINLKSFLCKITEERNFTLFHRHDFCDTPQQQSLPSHGSSGRGSGAKLCTPRLTPRNWAHRLCSRQFDDGKHDGFKSSYD